uniref:Uncharacterized protein n=1 Tax=Anguilla anguilla TaxID=7936 RepID=A0A0E9VIP7_ANGAN
MVLRGHTSLVPVVGAACNQKKNEKKRRLILSSVAVPHFRVTVSPSFHPHLLRPHYQRRA